MMKLTLDLEALDVASFVTDGARASSHGTVRAHESHLTGTETYRCPTPTCPTWAATCVTCAIEEQ